MPKRYKWPLTAWRIADARFPIWSGVGAAQQGGRWNSPGLPVIYCGKSYAICLLERLVQVNRAQLPKHQAWIEIFLPEQCAIEEITENETQDWQKDDYISSRRYGDKWLLEKRTLALIVPSALGAPVEKNVLINPQHPGFTQITISDPKPVVWDPRLTGA